MRYTTSFFLLMLFIISCRQATEEERMQRTTRAIIANIEKNEFARFRYTIGPDLLTIGKDDEMLYSDFKKFNGLLSPLAKGKDIQINITDLYNDLGQRIVDIPIAITPTAIPDSIYHLNLFFGPPNMFPLDRITGYKLTRGSIIPIGFHKVVGPAHSPM
ncbi:hypothetical protein [Chitinophaga eiseniae]|uniref:Uncharacterized protein n=1 Tax=Chitinophaga eiseniae TaxID=634771 RepID=A0A847S9Q1_9BACT|nr:hypothetical protein [Chitinophaga eiseniae]NLR79970.1 hypothetical protein [Chitinophaga eiseniae]